MADGDPNGSGAGGRSQGRDTGAPVGPGTSGVGRSSPGFEDLTERRDRLGQRLEAHRAATDPRGQGPAAPSSGYAQALKLGSEFVAGILVGAGIGWFFDKAVGTSPFGLIVFLLLGFAAGVLNVLRSQGVVPQPGVGKRPDENSRGGPPP